MESEGGPRLSKRFSDKGGEVDNQTKSGTAWSHSFLNQKPWHPLSYPNQRRKWIAEQIHAQHDRRAQEVSREFAQEQEFFRQAALISKKDQEKIETMKAVSFMYVRPPGYNPESAKAAELADESMRDGQQQAQTDGVSTSTPPGGEEGKKKPRPKDVFGRNLPTENEFEVLKNAPRMETGLPTRAKPFGVEVRNVKCVRCNTFGHQSGDRECPLKDAIMPNEESRLKRDDPLTAILAHTDPSEPLKWELKQKPGISPPRGGFRPDDPNQQIVAEDDDIFDEYGGFLGESVIPELLANFSSKPKKKSKKKNKRKRKQSSSSSGEDGMSSDEDDKKASKKKISKPKKKKRGCSESSSPDIDRHEVKNKCKESYLSDDEKDHRSLKKRLKHSHSYDDSHMNRWQFRLDKKRDRDAKSSEDSEPDHDLGATTRQNHSYSPEESYDNQRHRRSTKKRRDHSYSSEDSDGDERHERSTKNKQKHSHSYKESQTSGRFRREKSRDRSASSSEDSEAKKRHEHSYEDSKSERCRSSDKRRQRSKPRQSYSSEDSDEERPHRSRRSRDEPSHSYNDTNPKRHHSSRNNRHKH